MTAATAATEATARAVVILINRSAMPASGELAAGGVGSSLCSVVIGGSSAPLSREPVLGATVFRLAQTVPDGVRALVQAGGSPFDVAGRRPPCRIRLACKRSAVRARF